MNNRINLWNDPYHLSPYSYNANVTKQWEFGDSFENYLERKRKNPNLKTYLPEDFFYKFNNLGFRSDDFDNDTDIKILYSGCSLTEGVGLPLEHTWHGILNNFISKEIDKPLKTFNLGTGGASIDFITRSIYIIIEHYNFLPDMVNILLPPVMRKELITENKNNVVVFRYIPSYNKTDLKEIVYNYDKIISYRQQYHECFRNLLFLKYFLASKNIPFIFSFWDGALIKSNVLTALSSDNNHLKENDIIPKELEEHYHLGYFLYDKQCSKLNVKFTEAYPYEIARDFVHYGPNSHYNFANDLYRHMLNKSFFAKILTNWKL
jgi:hypothetical protein